MRVTRNTPAQLIVEHYSTLLVLILVLFLFVPLTVGTGLLVDGNKMGWFLAAIGLGAGALISLGIERLQVILDRPSGTLTIRRRNVRGYHETIHNLNDVDRAILETSDGSETEVYRATILITSGMSAGAHPLTEVYSSLRGHARVVDAINAWLGNEPTQIG